MPARRAGPTNRRALVAICERDGTPPSKPESTEGFPFGGPGVWAGVVRGVCSGWLSWVFGVLVDMVR